MKESNNYKTPEVEIIEIPDGAIITSSIDDETILDPASIEI